LARSFKRRLAVISGGAVAAAVLWVVITVLALPREDQLPGVAPAVVIVLSSSVDDDSTLDYPTTKRIETAMAYAREHNARLVTTRVHGRFGQSSEPAQRALIVRAGLQDRWTMLPDTVNSTRDEALSARQRIADTTIALVTSPLHSRRACATFERVGFRVTCVPSAQYELWRVPLAVLYESAAFVKYRKNGWW
jgi:uncharacterized SAM-binding protein YcdF (DUF218 family)